MMIPQDKPKSRLEAPPTQCPRCKTLMKVRKCVPLPGRKFVDVDYRCDECGAEVLRAVPLGPLGLSENIRRDYKVFGA